MTFTRAFCVIIVCAIHQSVLAASPGFQEIYDLLRTNLAGASETQLDQAAVAGLIEQLQPKVALVDGKDHAGAKTNAPIVPKASVFDNFYAYLRVGQFTD